MMFGDEDSPIKKPAAHEIGGDLGSLSVEDLAERIDLLRAEILRLEAEKERKSAGRRAADSFFR
ncbi:MAG: DUF1192 domain-containing protein [Alphaproteobacteria bacterium]|nr:DUF1192 domain-containing protein [Alphaproteobacteria bacterium]MBU1548400.1 DUF1192 domain-containing protein [Alphaproteobacteria bacterium]MBU2335838.1 DUF1192 domain-containing protein [Alphaproteobacteria bacterium]MBU2390767.1 DUF1192 domain-containing protein [Alphaproteobacteria bacterium]